MSQHDDFTRLFQDNYQLIYRYVLRRVSNPEVAGDLSGEVFYKAWRGRNALKGHTNARAWLLLIARNTVIDYWRKAKEVPMPEIEKLADESAVPILESIAQDEARWELIHTLDRLSGNYKTVLVLRFIEGLSVKEAANLLDMTEGNLRTTQFRALAQLRKEMGAQ